jgi:hypothetical protein
MDSIQGVAKSSLHLVLYLVLDSFITTTAITPLPALSGFYSRMAKPFPALPGFYQFLFLHVEPLSTLVPAFLIWFFPGATWFFNELIVGGILSTSLDSRTTMAIWQLASCYGLLGMLSSLVFRAARDALPNDPVAQERIVGASFKALAIADVSVMSHSSTVPC